MNWPYTYTYEDGSATLSTSDWDKYMDFKYSDPNYEREEDKKDNYFPDMDEPLEQE